MKSSISLFSGIGGLDEGLHRSGFTPLFCSEIDNNARSSLQHWCEIRNINPIIAADINDIDPHSLMKTLKLTTGELDLLADGPPCQSFSVIGKRQSLGDNRGLLLLKMIEFAKVFKPKAVLIEQVKGLLSAKGTDGKPGSALATIISDLECIGYKVSYKVLRAADYGVAQLRDRVFIIAIQGDAPFAFPIPTCHDPSKQPAQNELLFNTEEYKTVADAIADLPEPVKKGHQEVIPGHLDVTPPRDRERINGVPEGECLARQLHL